MNTRQQLRPLWRAALVVLAVAALIGAAAPSVSGQQSGATDEVVARIVARRHADQRVEFALQQQATGGSWGQRLLPPQRFFPTTATVGRWLTSTPLDLTGAVVARIVARRQHRRARRVRPATTDHGRLLGRPFVAAAEVLPHHRDRGPLAGQHTTHPGRRVRRRSPAATNRPTTPRRLTSPRRPATPRRPASGGEPPRPVSGTTA